MKRKKVYCEKCKYYKQDNNFFEHCLADYKMKHDYYNKEKVYQDPVERNKKNKCKLFKR